MTLDEFISESKEYAPLIAILISLIALLITSYNVMLSKRSFKVNQQQLQNKLANVDFYLIDSYCITFEKERLLIFHTTISNKSETKNSFSPTLYVEYCNSEDVSTKIKLRHIPELSNKITKHTFTFFPKEIFLNDKESVSKWLIFGYNIDITKNKRIDQYTLSLKDVNNNQFDIPISLMKELL